MPSADKPVAPEPASLKQPPSVPAVHIQAALTQVEDMNGWYFLGAVGTRLSTLKPDFDPRTYGCSKLLTLVEKLGTFDIRRESLMVYVRPNGSAAG